MSELIDKINSIIEGRLLPMDLSDADFKAIRAAIEERGRLSVQIAYWRGWAQGLRKEAGNLRIKDVKLIDEIADFKLDGEEGKGG